MILPRGGWGHVQIIRTGLDRDGHQPMDSDILKLQLNEEQTRRLLTLGIVGMKNTHSIVQQTLVLSIVI